MFFEKSWNGEVSHCTVAHNKESGIYTSFGGALILENMVVGNNSWEIAGHAGIRAESRAMIRSNELDGNHMIGIAVTDWSVIDGNSIILTQGLTPVAIKGWTTDYYVNNRMSVGTPVIGNLVNGGGNVVF